MKLPYFVFLFCATIMVQAQTYSGIILDQQSSLPLEGAIVTLVEEDQSVSTGTDGAFSIIATDSSLRTLQINKDGFVFEDLRKVAPDTNFNIQLRLKKKSAATLRWENYLTSCQVYNSPNIPDDPDWNMEWSESNLTGDLGRDPTYTRRDPTAVISHNGKYYVWYTYKLSEPSTWFNNGDPNLGGHINVFPWDNADLYYSTSTDGYHWEEQGAAVTRGANGSFDDQSVFTPEIFVHQDTFYLVYQVVQAPYVERVKNTIGMAYATSPDGPWTKLPEPILRPTDNGKWTNGSFSRLDADVKGDFDSHKVHDPCLRFYNNKFYLYYKGERMGEERICGQREIRWGVAIADHPMGPYAKSEYNPITTSGHEVAVWNHDEGIAIIQKLDGPERGTVQFAADGLNFEMRGRATHVPEALGIFRPEEGGNAPRDGVRWGLAHRYEWGSVTGGTNYLVRFDIEEPKILPSDHALIIEAETFTHTGGSYDDSNSGGPGFGVNRTGIGVNFVNAGDWMEYPLTVPETDDYRLFYFISTPTDQARVQFWVDGTQLADMSVPNNGQWDDYRCLAFNQTISLTKGEHTIRVVASGANTWQWNLDKIQLDPATVSSLASVEDSFSIELYPNPVQDELYILNLTEKVHFQISRLNGSILTQGVVLPDQGIKVGKLSTGTYVLKLLNSESKKVSALFVKQ